MHKFFLFKESFNHLPYLIIYSFAQMLLSIMLHQDLLINSYFCFLFVFSFCLIWSAVDPGTVETKIMREVPSCLSGVAFLVLKLLGLLQSPEKGISSILDAALAPPVSLTQSNYSYLLELNADTLQ
jgi:hypothetical protein